jgi:hypothetical protein
MFLHWPAFLAAKRNFEPGYTQRRNKLRIRPLNR